jgi:hypothetical protein
LSASINLNNESYCCGWKFELSPAHTQRRARREKFQRLHPALFVKSNPIYLSPLCVCPCVVAQQTLHATQKQCVQHFLDIEMRNTLPQRVSIMPINVNIPESARGRADLWFKRDKT